MKAKFLAAFLLIGLTSVDAAAQSPPPRKDIPTIAKAANGSIVSIVMSDDTGKPVAQGTGFIASKDGLIVTNYHVISEGTSATAKLPDGAFYAIDGVLACDKKRDIAVIKAHGQNFRTLTLGDSDRVQVGEEVVAIGSPLSLESTVSNGIISGIRTADELGGRFLQITSPISPGSSGGPLFNMTGEVVGITTMYLKGGENLNFAIPVNDVKPLLSNRLTKLQDLPNEKERAVKNGGRKRSNGGSSTVRYHIISYNLNTKIVAMQYRNKLVIAQVRTAEECIYKLPNEAVSPEDCRYVSSIAGTLVGEDVVSRDSCWGLERLAHCGFNGYILGDRYHMGDLDLEQVFKGPEKPSIYRNEVWEIVKVEEVKP